MSPRPRTTGLAVPILALALYAGARPIGPAPALGPFLDPANGVWAVAASAELPRSAAARIPGLGAPVRVVYDDRAVPHIFAASELDVARALGYVVARDRLFQMELQTLAASGRLTEIAGARALPLDREMRELGLPRVAERKLAALDPNSDGMRAARAFAEGVNAWIDGMAPRDLPLEYRLLGRRPVRWEPVNSLHLLNRMGWTLAYSDDERVRLRAQARVGRDAADALFPVVSRIQEPIQPNGQRGPRWDTRPLPPPGAPDTAAILADRQAPIPPDVLGSNNWAVAPARTAAGRALLAGDPHLELTLPSIWYETHLVVPGQLDVYGVTVPGAPFIVIGFNRDVAWTFTNTQSDVVDYYVETVDDPVSPTTYSLDGEWRPLERRVETYRGEGGEVVAVDTVRYTHRGPLRRAGRAGQGAQWLSVRWTLYDPMNESDAFVGAERARTVAEWMRAMEPYSVPAQNMLVADRTGTIAIRSTGHFPIRPGDGRGDVLRDGSTRASDWTGFWPVAEYPQAVNPAQGFLASANQQPVDPAVNPRYIGSNWYPPWRAMRINALLRADYAVTPDAMRRYQTDPGSARADAFAPAFLEAARRHGAATSGANGGAANGGSTDGSMLARAAALLAEWDQRYTKDNERAVLFEYAMGELGSRLWDELRAPAGGRGDDGPEPRPADAITAVLLADSASVWWDDRRTPAVERRDDILAASP